MKKKEPSPPHEPATESPSTYDNLEQMSAGELLRGINKEDQGIPHAVEKAIPMIERLAEAVIGRLQQGGRLFYIGAGTSGRLGILDASECPPTYGVSPGLVIGLIAGGDQAIREAVEFAEDDYGQAWKDLTEFRISPRDIVIGIAASGRTPYVVGGLRDAQKAGVATGCITCNTHSEVARYADYPVEVVVGPEFVTGSTRMKSGTAQKLILNMISTTVMIRLGRVRGNKMVDMQLTNTKLLRRGVNMVMAELDVDEAEAARLLEQYGSVRRAIDSARG